MKALIVLLALAIETQALDLGTGGYMFQPRTGQEFDRLMTTWRGPPHPYGFYPIPRTVFQAKYMGWVKLSSCSDNNQQ